jgi:flavin-dependent dehydrogenase
LIRVDVLILGGGPAGAVAALNLAPTRRVVLVERREPRAPRIGEALPSAARRLLTDMGLFDQFIAQGHAPCYGNRSIWGNIEAVETDFLRDPDGHGWHLDRERFDAWLRYTAVARGATLLMPGRPVAVKRGGDGWHVRIATVRAEEIVSAAFAIDAGGRAAPLARRIGARRRVNDRLVGGWLYGSADPTAFGAGLTVVEAVEDGWWYTAPVPDGRRVLAFLTDADLPAARIAHDSAHLIQHAVAAREIHAILVKSGFAAVVGGFTAAHSSVLEPCSGADWLAAGDASMSFDPLSSQGLLHALFSGLAAAETANSCLAGDDHAVLRYRRAMNSIQQAYRRHLDFYYASETRWPAAPFWQRRRDLRSQEQAATENPWSG